MLGENDMVKDPVCGMEIDEKDAVPDMEYEGETYYFCSASCYEKFTTSPQIFAETAGPGWE